MMGAPPSREPDQARINEMTAHGRVTYFDTTLRLDGRHARLVIGTDEAPELEAAWRSCATALIRVGKSRMRAAPAVRQP